MEVGIGDFISKIAAVFSHRHDRVLRRSLPSFLSVCFSPVLSYPDRESLDSKRQRKEEYENVASRRPASIDSFRRLESVGWEIEIRIEFARAWKSDLKADYLSEETTESSLTALPLIQLIQIAAFKSVRCAKYSFLLLLLYRWRRGVCSREFQIGHLSKVPLFLPSFPVSRRKHFRESTWRKYLKISATVAGKTEQKQDASIFARTCVAPSVVKIESLFRDG